MSDLWRRAQHGWPARYPIIQAPNAPLLVAAAARAAGVRPVALAALAAWGWLEVTDGANLVRRLYGVGGLALVAAELRRGAR